MSSAARLTKSPEEVATQIFEDLHRGLARALETRQAAEFNDGTILFPYNKNTRDTLLYLAAQEFSLPITYTWGTEGPYFMPLRDKIGPNDFTQIANETHTHYPLINNKWNIRTKRNSRRSYWKDRSPQVSDISRPDRSITLARSPITPTVQTLESFFAKQVKKLENRLPGASFVEIKCIERDFRRSVLADEFPTETQVLYESALQLSNIFEITNEHVSPTPSTTLADFNNLSTAIEKENEALLDLFADLQQHTKSVFYHSIRANFFQASLDDEREFHNEETDEREDEGDTIGDLVENIDSFFSVSRAGFRYIAESDQSHKSKRKVGEELDQFYKQRLWPLIAHSIGMTEAQGPQLDTMKERARKQRNDCYYSFSSDLTELAKTIKAEIS